MDAQFNRSIAWVIPVVLVRFGWGCLGYLLNVGWIWVECFTLPYCIAR